MAMQNTLLSRHLMVGTAGECWNPVPLPPPSPQETLILRSNSTAQSGQWRRCFRTDLWTWRRVSSAAALLPGPIFSKPLYLFSLVQSFLAPYSRARASSPFELLSLHRDDERNRSGVVRLAHVSVALGFSCTARSSKARMRNGEGPRWQLLSKSGLEITGLQSSTVSARQTKVREVLETSLKVLDTFLTGSNSRSTGVYKSPSRVRFRTNRTSNRHRRMTELDPLQTWAAQDFRTAKALFVPSLKRGIIPPLHE